MNTCGLCKKSYEPPHTCRFYHPTMRLQRDLRNFHIPITNEGQLRSYLL